MKQNLFRRYLVLFFIFTSTCTMAQSENDKRIELGEQVFTALQTNNVELYRNLYPSFEEYKSLMQQMVNAKIDGLTQEQMNVFLEDYKSKADSTYKAEFLELRRQANSLKINWNAAEFLSFESIAAFPDKITVKYLDGTLKIKFGEAIFIMDVEGFEFNPSYKLQAVKNIQKYE
jgi:hypothetical protein